MNDRFHPVTISRFQGMHKAGDPTCWAIADHNQANRVVTDHKFDSYESAKALADSMNNLDPFTRGYLEAALWTSDPDPQSGEWSESDTWNIDAIEPASLARAVEVCKDFQESNRTDLDEVNDTYHVDDSRHGHDFWLTRNGHGAGFWDRGYDLNHLGDKLTKAAKAYGSAYVFGPETTDQGDSTSEQIESWDGIIRIEE